MTIQTWNITFVGDYFSLVTTVEVEPEDTPEIDPKDFDALEEVAIDLAKNILSHHYGWDMEKVATVEITGVRDTWL